MSGLFVRLGRCRVGVLPDLSCDKQAFLTAFMVINVGLAGAAIVRWSNRHYGIEATNKIEKTLDNLAPDEWMEKKFMDWKFIK